VSWVRLLWSEGQPNGLPAARGRRSRGRQLPDWSRRSRPSRNRGRHMNPRFPGRPWVSRGSKAGRGGGVGGNRINVALRRLPPSRCHMGVALLGWGWRRGICSPGCHLDLRSAGLVPAVARR